MRWQLVALIAYLPLMTAQVAHAQDGAPAPSCQRACQVNPFTAPVGCDCNAPRGEATEAPADQPQTDPAPPAATRPLDQPAPSEAGVPSCELACRVNPFTAPAACACNGGGGGGAGTTAPAVSSPPAAAPSVPAPAATAGARAPAPAAGLRSWAAQPGATVRNSFGPAASDCRGACGPGCRSAQSCESGARYECLGGDRLLRIETYACGTHQGCRVHDDCLDRCAQANAQGVDCEAVCHLEAVKEYGTQNAMSWLQGGGPYDADPIHFEYTSSAPGMPEPSYRCSEGTRLECGGGAARCLTAAGVAVEPVFDAFPAAGGAISVSRFRSGRLCEQGPGGSTVCEQTVDIQVTGAAACAQGAGSAPCTRFGFEFDYQRANPAVPLMCSASSRGGTPDLPAFMVAQGLSAVVSQERGTDLGAALGGLQDALRSGRSLEDVLSGVSVAPLDGNGRPIESERVGASPAPAAAPATPSRIAFEGANGRLVVPLYELHDPSRSGQIVEREVECSYNGTPVLETRFRLHFAGN
jgi:hypothetical protein